MADDPSASSLIGGQYAVAFGEKLPGAAGGLQAFAATDRRGRTDLMAVEVAPWRPPRAQALGTMMSAPAEGVLSPLAHGPASVPGGPESYFIIVQAPSGPSLAAPLRPWSEPELLDLVLRPAVQALDRLYQRRVTHRAIRPDNLFRSGPGQPVVLGEAWAAPPASLQPALFEPPYVAMCLRAGRGDGTIMDDVYALGATMLVLALGRMPLEGLDDVAVTRRKLERGSFAAIAGEERLPGLIGDLVRGMLAEDPDHRPPLALLADPAAARARRVAARPPRRAQRPFDFAGGTIWDARALAHAISCEPAAGAATLRDGSAERWLRRSLGEPALATRIVERVAASHGEAGAPSPTSDAILLTQAASILDPLAPICWPGSALLPDGLGTAMAAAQGGPPGLAETLTALISTEAARLWATERPDRCDAALVRTEARQYSAALRARSGGAMRLLYSLNPLLRCGSPLLAGHCVARIVELLPALEAASPSSSAAGGLPVDQHIAAFTAVRAEEQIDRAVLEGGEEAAAAQLRLLAKLQARFPPGPLPLLAGWLAGHAGMLFASWHNRPRREQLAAALRARAESGQLGPMLALVDNGRERAADAEGAARAAASLAAADAELSSLASGSAGRAEQARRLGQEIAAGSGLAALVVALALAAFG